MTQVQIHRFSPEDVDDVRAAVDVGNDALAVDAPWSPPALEERFLAHLRLGWDSEPPTPYLLCADRRPVGFAELTLTQRENTHLGWVSLAVRPDHRRRGYGTALFERMAEEARSAGRTSIGAEGWDCHAAFSFAARFGLEARSRGMYRRQHLKDIDRSRLRALYDEAAAVTGEYELLRVVGRTPTELRAPVAELAAAINDAPTDDLDVEDMVLSPERLTEYEDAMLARGDRLYRLVARHRDSGALAGHTVVAVESVRSGVARQHDTAVARAHRGHRLGLLLKTGMLLWLAGAEPQIETVDTHNAESNDHMISVNEALGYRVMARAVEFQGFLDPPGR